MLRSLYVDLNSYFASVEQQADPALRGKPVAVVPVMADTTCAIAASYEAKRFGVKTGTIIADAKVMCPDLILVHAHHTLYVDYHHRIIEAVEKVIHVKSVNSIDEMVCDLTGSDRLREKAVRIAHDVKRSIKEHVGSEMQCSVGIAPNDYLAKTATDMQKPDGLVVIEQNELPGVLYSMELQDLCGIGRQMYKRLWKHGIYTVEMLCTATKQQLHDVWGGVEGDRLWARLRGEDVPHVETHKSTVGHSHVLEPALRTHSGATGVVHRLLQKAATRLRQYGLATAEVTVSIRFVGGERWKCECDITPTQDVIQLTGVMSAMLSELPESGTPFKVSIALNKVSPAGSTPQPLFTNIGPARESLNASIDRINKKYGKNTLYLGPAWNALSSAPMRIAFTHIPDLETDEDE
ncbi:MAG: DNA polymerase [Candidatus Kapabacteria bacterium]|nr:DNA polymerase [Candidatus Kapabacteria bacterium]